MTTRNTQMAREMIVSGHTKEAAEWAKLVANSLTEAEVRALIHVLADAILSPVPRKRGDKFVNRGKLETLGKEMRLYDELRESTKERNAAFDTIGPKRGKSGGTAKRLYYKHKPKDSK